MSREQKAIKEIQDWMAMAARPAFSEKDIEDLNIAIRLMDEFREYLAVSRFESKFERPNQNELIYVIDSIFLTSSRSEE